MNRPEQEIVIEPAENSDAGAILALQKRAYQSEARLYPGIVLPPLVQTLEEMENDLRTMTVLKALGQGRILGSVRALEEKGICTIGRLIVDPEHQGRGIGTRLMAAVEEAFPRAGAFELFTGEKSTGNLDFYKRLGYAPTRERKISAGLTLVFLRKNQPS